MKLQKPTKHQTSIALASLIVLVLVVTGLAISEAHMRAQRNAELAKVNDTTAKIDNLSKQVADLKTKLGTEHTNRMAVCSYVGGLTTAKATRSLVVVPVVACTP